MSPYEEMLCTGSTGCGHPWREHADTYAKDPQSACRHKLAQGRSTCACTRFKGILTNSSVQESTTKGPGD